MIFTKHELQPVEPKQLSILLRFTTIQYISKPLHTERGITNISCNKVFPTVKSNEYVSISGCYTSVWEMKSATLTFLVFGTWCPSRYILMEIYLSFLALWLGLKLIFVKRKSKSFHFGWKYKDRLYLSIAPSSSFCFVLHFWIFFQEGLEKWFLMKWILMITFRYSLHDLMIWVVVHNW